MASGAKKPMTFHSSLGSFTAVANKHKIQAICDERDERLREKHKLREKHNNLRETFHTLDMYVFPNMDSVVPRNGFIHTYTTVNEMQNMWGAFEAIDNLTRLDQSTWTDLPRATLVRTTGMVDVLIPGANIESFHAEDADEAKAIARLVCGDEKAAAAQALTPLEIAEFRGIEKGMQLMLDMMGKQPSVDVENRFEEFSPCFQATAKSNSRWITKCAPIAKGSLPPKYFQLYCTPDERPWLVFAFARKLYAHFDGDYDRTVQVFRATCETLHEARGAQHGHLFEEITGKEVQAYLNAFDAGASSVTELLEVARAFQKRVDDAMAEIRAEAAAAMRKYAATPPAGGDPERACQRREGKRGRTAIKKEKETASKAAKAHP
jgi:hypothetical protein